MRTQTTGLALVIALHCPFASAQWVQTNGPFGMDVGGVALRGSTVLAAGQGLYRSTDFGDHWSKSNTGLPNLINVSIAASDSLFVVGRATGGIVLSRDDGSSWVRIADYALTLSSALAIYRHYILALGGGTQTSVFMTSDRGYSWLKADTGLPSRRKSAIAATDSRVFVAVSDSKLGANDGGVYSTTDPALGWTSKNTGLPSAQSNEQRIFRPLIARGANVFVVLSGMMSGADYRDRVFMSSETGASWHQINDSLFGASVRCLSISDSVLYAANGRNAIFRSTDMGKNWTSLFLPFADIDYLDALAVATNTILAGTYGGLYRSTDEGRTWSVLNDGILECPIACFLSEPERLIVGTQGMGCFVSSDSGDSWEVRNEGFVDPFVQAIARIDTVLLAGTSVGVYRSINNGSSWSQASPSDLQVNALAVLGNDVFVGTEYYGVWRSTDLGLSWAPTGALSGHVQAFATRDMMLFAGTAGPGVFRSTDRGSSWTTMNNGLPSSIGVYTFSVLDSFLFAGTTEGVFQTSTNGSIWSAIGLRPNGPGVTFVQAMTHQGKNLFVTTNIEGHNHGIFLSTDADLHWSDVGTGLPSEMICALSVHGPYLFAGFAAQGVWRRPLAEMITSAERALKELPREFCLDQNYPNPFNPKTVVSYQLPVVSSVRLVVYDILGREVAMLVNERKEAGFHEVTFSGRGGSARRVGSSTFGGDGSSLASGVYFYRLQASYTDGGQAGTYVQTRKLLLVR